MYPVEIAVRVETSTAGKDWPQTLPFSFCGWGSTCGVVWVDDLEIWERFFLGGLEYIAHVWRSL